MVSCSTNAIFLFLLRIKAAHNNSFDHFWYENDAAPVNNCPQYGCTVDNATVFKVVPPATLPLPALAIMHAAGADPELQHYHKL